ncbi:MAG: hypothetical protein ACYSRZ_05395, partial [Planctomycetota bacterium]
ETEYVHGSGLSIRKSNVTARGNIIRGYAASTAITTYTGVYPEYGYQNMRFENNLIYDSRSPYYCVRFFDVGSNFVFNNNTITGTHNPDRGGVHYYESALTLEGYATSADISTIQVCNNIIVGYNNWGLSAASDQGAKVSGNLFYSYCGDGGLWRDQSWIDANLPGNRVYCWDTSTPDDFGLVGVPGSVFKGGYLFDYWAYYRIPGTRAQGTEHNVDLGDSFSLALGSYAIGFADANYAPATDICGNLRDGYPDAGAYEYACLYVSADSPNNPGTGTLEDPYRQIQYAIDAANRGYNIFVACGIYNELITIEDGIYLHGGYLPDNWELPSNPDANVSVIDANSLNDSTVHIIGADAIITGFTIMGGSAENGGGIYCERSKAVIGNCTITSNQASGYGGGIYCESAEPIIYNCRIAANQAGDDGGGIYDSDGPIVNCTVADNIAGNYSGGLFDCNGPVTNCIIWGNSDSSGTGQSAQIDSFHSDKVNYNCIQGWSGNSDGTGNIGVDPLFVDATNGDYHLQSQKSRWDGTGDGGWVTDSLTSPCVDAGNPGQPLGDEPADVDNIRINMGSYGGTAKASMTPAGWAITADMTNDGCVSFADLEYWSRKWLDSADSWFGDLDSSRVVDMADFAIFAERWLAETSWYEL